MINCQITNISQEFDLSSRQQKTFANILLPNKRSVRVPVDEDTAAAIIAIALETQGKDPIFKSDYDSPPKTNGHLTPGTAPDGTEAMIFGGGRAAPQEADLVDEVERKLSGQVGEGQGVRSAPVENAAPPRARARLVGADEKGNPIMEYAGGVDPGTVTGGPTSNSDEDGVQQL